MSEKKIALQIKNLKVSYGAIQALKGIDLTVYEGDVVAILGANGAGKTTTLKKISGIIESVGGSIELYGQDITKMEPAAMRPRTLKRPSRCWRPAATASSS